MKKLFYPLFGLAALAMTGTSCQDELDNGGATNGNEAVVSFKVQLENETGSRAAGDGTTAKELHYAVYKVTDAANMPAIGDEIEALRGAFITDAEGKVTDKTVDVNADLTAEVKFTLVKGQTYNFLFWAQCEGGTKYYTVNYDKGTIDLLYDEKNDDPNTTGIKEVTATANDEQRDAFFKVRKSLKVDGPIEETITLKRPFAQVNVGTQIGSLKDAQTAEVKIEKSEFVVDNVATCLDAYSGSVSTPKDEQGKPMQVKLTFTQAAITESNHTDNVGDLKDVDGKNYEHLAMNYILVDDNNYVDNAYEAGSKKAIVNATLKLYGTGGNETGKPINTFEIPNIPVQRNWRTNIIGDILNETVTFNIVIDPNFDNDHNYFTEEELAYAFANGGEITLPTGPDGKPLQLTLTEPLILDDADNFVTINLNGATIKSGKFAEANGVISNGETDSYPFFVKAGTLNIKGEGKIQSEACKYSMAVFANGGTVNIYGGEYSNAGEGSDLIYAKNGGKVNIYGGTFTACEKQEGVEGTGEKHSALNLYKNGEGGSAIQVYGGKFYLFNPADNKSESPKVSFVADGYAVKYDETTKYYEVVEYTDIFTAGTDVTMYADIKADEKIVLAAGQDLDGKDKTLEMVKSTAQYGIQSAGGTIKNLTVKGYNKRNSQGAVIRGILISEPTQNVEIENVTVSGVAYPLNTATKGTAADLTLTVKNSTLIGWSSWDGGFASANFEKCTFGVGTYFTGKDEIAAFWNGAIRPYIPTTFNECTFAEGFKLMVDKLSAGSKLTFKGCKVGETVLTASNIEELLGAAYDANTIEFN